MSTTQQQIEPERVALLEALAQQRYFLLHTVDGLTDEQARLTPTASELCLGGLITIPAAFMFLARPGFAADEANAPEPVKPTGPNRIFQASEVTSTGSVTIGGKAVSYQAVAGTLVVHGPGWDACP